MSCILLIIAIFRFVGIVAVEPRVQLENSRFFCGRKKIKFEAMNTFPVRLENFSLAGNSFFRVTIWELHFHSPPYPHSPLKNENRASLRAAERRGNGGGGGDVVRFFNPFITGLRYSCADIVFTSPSPLQE